MIRSSGAGQVAGRVSSRLHCLGKFGDLGFADPSGEELVATGRLAVGGSGVMIVDPVSGELVTLRQVNVVSSLGFARAGELLAIGGADGTIRIWDIERGDSAGLAWRGTGQRVEIPFQDDPSAASLWVTSGGTLFELPLDAELWIERACEVVGRDLTQAEWDAFVPGGGQVQPACA